MDSLWILTEERPKESVIKQIIDLYIKDFKGVYSTQNEIRIKPDIQDGFFKFSYTVEGVTLKDINKIKILAVSGNSSFFDFLVFKQDKQPEEGSSENLLMAIEETKTSDDESRNTGVYQRASKFVFIDAYTSEPKLYMLYNDELCCREDKKPSNTSIFGTNMLLSLKVDIIGKCISKWFAKFNTIKELIDFKSQMKKPPQGNVPIEITQYPDRIEISGRLSKPAMVGNIGHDPNIGALSIISKTLRFLGWNKKIVITKHGVSQKYVTKTKGDKFLYICKILNLDLEGITIQKDSLKVPDKYWHYEMKSEKMASILLHIIAEYYGEKAIYQNHAGCERGYFKTKDNKLIALPKKDTHGDNLLIPDLILYDAQYKKIILIEGKKLSTLENGLREIEDYDSIEKEFIKRYYPECDVVRYVSIFGGDQKDLPHKKVLFYLNDEGLIVINPNAPECILNIFKTAGILT